MKEKKGGELRDIKVKEVSMVDAPANRRKWLFFKSDLKKAEADFFVQQGMEKEAAEIYISLLSADPGNEEIKKKLETAGAQVELK